MHALVFRPGSASNENSLIAADRSIVVENNFGYKDAQKDTTHGRTTKPKGPATTDPWYFTAVDFHSGEVVYSRRAGAGVLGGVVAVRDTE